MPMCIRRVGAYYYNQIISFRYCYCIPLTDVRYSHLIIYSYYIVVLRPRLCSVGKNPLLLSQYNKVQYS